MDTAGKDAKKIQEYIQKQLKDDQVSEHLALDIQDPFTGGKWQTVPTPFRRS